MPNTLFGPANNDYLYGVGTTTPWQSLSGLIGTPMESILYGRDAIFDNGDPGGEGSMGADPNNAYVYFGSTAQPGKGGTQNKFSTENAQIVQAALKQFYPNATPEQIQNAAFAALKQNPAGQTYQVTQTPGEIFAGIAKNLGGVTPEAKNWMDANAPAWQERKKQIQTFLNQEESYRNKGALRDLAAVAAITAPAWGSALLGANSPNWLLAENSFDSGAMANAMGYSPGAAAAPSASLLSDGNFGAENFVPGPGGVTPAGTGGGMLSTPNAGLTNLLTPEALAATGVPAAEAATAGALGITPTVAGSTAATAAGLFGLDGLTAGSLIGPGLGLVGNLIGANAAKNAATDQANAQIEAAKIAAEAAKFKPVGVTTRFGESKFGYDDKGNLTSAGYTLSPDMLAQQDKLLGASNGYLDQYLAAKAATAPMGQAANTLFGLGNSYLSTSPQEQAAKYMRDQQALLAAGRESSLANLQNKLAAQGRLGLAVGGTSTGQMATNPEMAAYYNAIQQQDLGLAANATQGGMDYAKFGAGLVGSGGDMLNSMYGVQNNAYAPYATAMGGAQYLEGLGQNALDQGIRLGSTVTAANANAGTLLANGMTNAANTMAPANAFSPWGSLLTGAGNVVSNYNAQQQQANNNSALLAALIPGWGK